MIFDYIRNRSQSNSKKLQNTFGTDNIVMHRCYIQVYIYIIVIMKLSMILEKL